MLFRLAVGCLYHFILDRRTTRIVGFLWLASIITIPPVQRCLIGKLTESVITNFVETILSSAHVITIELKPC